MSDDIETEIIDTEPPADPAREDGPWGFKRFPIMERDMAIKAAKRAKMTISDWVAEAIRAHVESERDESRGLAVFPPSASEVVPYQGQAPLNVCDIGQAVQIAERIATLRGRPVPVRLLSGAMRALAERIKAG